MAYFRYRLRLHRMHRMLWLGLAILQTTNVQPQSAFASVDAAEPHAPSGAELGAKRSQAPENSPALRPIRLAQVMQDSRTGVLVLVPMWLRGNGEMRR